MRIIEQKIYKFDELGEKAKEKAIRDHINFESEVFNPSHEIEGFISELEREGFDNAKIQYSGFNSQGDGLIFDADINLKKFVSDYRIQLPLLAKRIDGLDDYISSEICRNRFSNRYSHEKTRYSETTINNVDRRIEAVLVKEIKLLNNLIEDDRLTLCKKFYGILEKDYESRLDEDNIIENLKLNEYEFTEKGEIYND